jgi:protein-disulfide isomerase
MQDNSNLNFRLLIRHYPLMGHRWARPAAELTVCAYEQNDSLFWLLHDLFFAFPASNAPSDPLDAARKLLEASPKFNQSKFNECMQSGRAVVAVEADMRLASALGVSATPTVFVNGINIGALTNGDHLRSVLKQARYDTKQ